MDYVEDVKAQLCTQALSRQHLSANCPILRGIYLDKTLSDEVLASAYLLEEYRLQVFTQGQVKVVGKVSEKRLDTFNL